MPNSPDRPAIRPWAKGQPVDHRRLNELQGAVITDIQIHGPPGTQTIRKGNSLAIFLPTPPPAPSGTFRVLVLGPESGAGKYYGHVVRGESTPVSVTTDLAVADLGCSIADDEEVVIFNTLEKDMPGSHWLTDGAVVPGYPIVAWWHDGGAVTDETPPRRIACISDVGRFHNCPEEEEEEEAMMAFDDNDGVGGLDDGTYT